MIGTTISHYRVEKKLGEGGMGKVYLAEDTSLKRRVALKFLPSHLQENETSLKRFLREAESAAALEHPYICNIKEVAKTDDGQNFIVMEYVEGQTLKEKLDEGPIPVGEAVRIASEVSEALELAHDRGIVHRDLKPSNIMLTPQGHAKVMDFGLAKRVGDFAEGEQEITSTLTREGSTLGTLAYMSPEQLRGSSIDSRSDIFSFGIVLYEMLTEIHPFRKNQSMETASAILTAEPDSLSSHNKEIPESLEYSVLKMLKRNPEERYQSIGEVVTLLNDPTAPWKKIRWSSRRLWGVAALAVTVILVITLLGWWTLREGNGIGSPSIASVAVLPLVNLSGDPTQEYFADGMTDALITDLSKIGALKVISRSSAMFYKGTNKSLSEIAGELGVDAIVEGSVLKEGDQIGIAAKVIEAASGENLWADRYQRNLTSILALQGEMARTIASQIHVALTPAEESLLTRTREVNPEAYEAYLKGLSHFYKLHPTELEKARLYFEEARDKDPELALAHVGIAQVWMGFRQMGVVPSGETRLKVKAAIERAFELDDSLPEAYAVLAGDKTWGDWDWKGGEAAFLRAIELRPNFPGALVYYSHLLCYLGRIEEAVELAERATQLDPFNPLFQSISACTLFFAGRIEEATARSQSALKASPENPVALSNLWEIYSHQGRYEEAAEFAKATLVIFGSPLILDVYDQGFAEGGYKGALKRVADLMAEISRETFIEPYWLAQLNLVAGEKERALDLLEKGYEIRSPNMPYIIWQIFDPLRDEPRYRELLRKMKYPEEVIAWRLNE